MKVGAQGLDMHGSKKWNTAENPLLLVVLVPGACSDTRYTNNEQCLLCIPRSIVSHMPSEPYAGSYVMNLNLLSLLVA